MTRQEIRHAALQAASRVVAGARSNPSDMERVSAHSLAEDTLAVAREFEAYLGKG